MFNGRSDHCLYNHNTIINSFWKISVIFLSLNPYIAFIIYNLFKTIRNFEKIDSFNNRHTTIPDGLLFGAGTSAFQVEGALKSHGKSESYVEFYMSQSKQPMSDSPEISSDSYHKYKDDVKALKYIGLNIYRFSMSWPRLLPTGYANNVNQEGVDYYHALLDELEKAEIEPMVTLHHFDHPAVFEKFGGWQNESMVELFKNYAGFVFKEFGHRVKYFLTFNEPSVFCNLFGWKILYNQGTLNNNESSFLRTYRCSHNVLKAHAEAYHLYHNEFNHDKKGLISINLLCQHYFTEEEKERYLADVAFAFSCGWFANPIFSKTGDYSDILKQRVNETNALRGNENLQLPAFSKLWIEKIRGSADFFGLSYYASSIVELAPISNQSSSFNIFIPSEARLILKRIPNQIPTAENNYTIQERFRWVLNEVKEKYDNPPIHIIENGFSDDGRLNDTDRIKFIYAHVKQIIDAINNDQCNVKSYIYWSLIDNFEFWAGYSTRFGLTHIDFNSPNRTRTLKVSATWLRNFLLKKQLYIE